MPTSRPPCAPVTAPWRWPRGWCTRASPRSWFIVVELLFAVRLADVRDLAARSGPLSCRGHHLLHGTVSLPIPPFPPVVSTTQVASSPISHVAEVLAGVGGVADYPDLLVGDRHGDGLLLGDQEPPQPGPPGADIVGSAGQLPLRAGQILARIRGRSRPDAGDFGVVGAAHGAAGVRGGVAATDGADPVVGVQVVLVLLGQLLAELVVRGTLDGVLVVGNPDLRTADGRGLQRDERLTGAEPAGLHRHPAHYAGLVV